MNPESRIIDAVFEIQRLGHSVPRLDQRVQIDRQATVAGRRNPAQGSSHQGVIESIFI